MIPSSTCERASDNKHASCPPRMSDGRHFTDYTPKCALNLAQITGQPLNSYDLRQYLIHNAEDIMLKNRTTAVLQNTCGPCVDPWNHGTMLQEQSAVKCDKNTCSVTAIDPYGLGQGRDFGIPPDHEFIKTMTDRNNALKANPTNVCTSKIDEMGYYPLDSLHANFVQQEDIGRPAIPGGGLPFPGRW